MSFKQKFAAVMMLPLVVGIIFAVIGLGSEYSLAMIRATHLVLMSFVATSLDIAYKRCILGRTKNLTRHLGTLISSLMLIAYFLYIYITRLLLDVFNCTPTDPPDGKLYLQVGLSWLSASRRPG